MIDIDIQKIALKAARSENSRLLGCGVDDLERFAILIREAVVAELVAGSGEPEINCYDEEFRTDVWGYTADQLAGAVLRERERCAKVCVASKLIDMPTTIEIAAVRKCAAAIRSAE